MRIAYLLAIAALVAACAEPLPPARTAYAGDWQAQNMRLLITPAGQVHYQRLRGNGSTKIDAPIHSFEGDDFIVGWGPFKTKFVVQKPPHREGNVWKMTVDGVELVRDLAPGDNKAGAQGIS